MIPRHPFRSPLRYFFRALAIVAFFAAFLAAFPSMARAANRPTDSAAAPAPAATITFRKIFKTSFPEYVEIKLNQQGAGTFDIRQLDEEPNPQPLQIGAPLTERIFALAAKLHNFQGVDLEVRRRLANLGEKTFTYESGGETHETKFNYTLDESASQLVNIFEGISREYTDLADLTRTMRYDHLGVNDVLITLEGDYNNKLIPEPERLLPVLDQLAGDEKFIDIARQRARTLANRIRGSH